MSFSHLSPETIRKIRKFFTDNKIEYNAELRSLMLDKINFEYQQGLKKYSTDYYQFSGDLNNLNSRTHLADGTLPLEIWLQNGLDNHGQMEGKEVFDQALAEMKAGPDRSAEIPPILVTFDKLSELIRNNDFADDAVKFYRRIFQTALKEFEVIADYKSLHDTLHQLQLGWNNISPLLDLLPSNPSLQMTVLNYSPRLENTVIQLNGIRKKKAVDASEGMWIDELSEAQKKFEITLNGEERAAIEEDFHQIKIRLDKRLSLLNTRLKEAISHLHLKDLIDAMRDLCSVLEELAPPELASSQVQEFNKGVKEMSVLDENLTKLIIQHDEWQKMDTMLRSFGDLLGENADPEEERSTSNEEYKLRTLKRILNIIQTKIGPLLEAKPTKSSVKLTKAAENFKLAIDEKDTDKAGQWFDSYREQAWHYFFDLDAEMKAKCDELKLIGDKLDKVNQQL